MATNSSGAPRLSIEIEAVTDKLKKGLADARKELNDFNKSVNNRKLGSGVKDEIDAERLAQSKYRTEAAKSRSEIAKLALEKRKNNNQTKALSGSYREAQQRLTALGKSIREAEGGFKSTTPEVRAQIKEYRNLNGQLKDFDKQMGLNYRNVGNYSSALNGIAPGLARLGTIAGVAAGSFAILNDARKTIMNFDSGMRNVEKTTGLATKEVRALGQELVNMSKSLQTVSVQKLTEYATIAGQLGVKGTRDITAFSEALAKLETATNISGEEGGTEIARTLTLIDGGVQNVAKFGDEIVNLGNNFATTEREILSNAESIAQNVGIYRIGRQDVLAFATATKAVGIEAELVGSSFNRTLAGFEKMIRNGKTAGTVLSTLSGTQAELSQRFQNDAAGVYVDIVRALNNVHKAGGNVNEELDALGIRAVRDRRVIQSLATNGFDVLTSAIDTARNSVGALDEEFDTASKKLVNQTGRIKIAWENLILSIEDGQGIIGRATVNMAGYFADLLGEINRLVTSSSWNEFFDRFREFGESGGGRLMTESDLRKQFQQTKAFTDSRFVQTDASYYSGLSAQEFNKELELARSHQEKIGTASDALQAAIITGRIKTTKAIEFEYKRQEAFATRHLRRLEQIGRDRGFIALGGGDEVSGKSTETTGGGDKSSKESLKTLQEIQKLTDQITKQSLNSYDAKLFDIQKKYENIYKTVSNPEILALARQNEETEKLKVGVDRVADSVVKLTKEYEKLTRQSTRAGITLAGISVPSSLPNLEIASANINRPRVSNLTDDFTKQFQSTLRRGVSDSLNTLFSGLGDWGTKAYDIEKKYNDLRANASAQEIESLNEMERLERRINNGLTNTLSKLGTSLASIGGNMLSSAISAGISSGDFEDLAKMFKGDNKAMGYGAAASLAGNLLGGVLKPSDVTGQTLSGALSGGGTGAAIGTAIAPGVGSIIGAVGGAIIGGISSLFGSKARKREEELAEQQLKVQRDMLALQQRQAMLSYTSQVIGQMTNQGAVTSVERDALGNLETKIRGKDIALVLERNNSGRG